MTGTYDFPLVALSYVVAVIASYVALDLAGRVTATQGRRAGYWLAGGAFAMGTGIWSMHFIGMLAFHLSIPIVFAPGTTAISLLIAIAVSGLALHTASRSTMTWGRLVLAGAVMGVGIAAMHYTGMAAIMIDPRIDYEPLLFAASIVVAIVTACTALWLAFQLRSPTVSYIVGKKLGSAFIMGAAVVAMHYTGMAAAIFAPGSIGTSPMGQFSSNWLALAIAACTILLLAATMLISIVDSRVALLLKTANDKISELARTDALTSLANRRSFLERLTQEFAASKRGGKPFAVLYLDLDHFKQVNDTLGHPIGDRLLVEVSQRLTKVVRETDLVGRFGGDEFAVLQTNVTDPTAAGTLAVKIGSTLAAPYTIEGNDIRISASIGIAPYTAAIDEVKDMIMQADLALYRAKEEGRNRYHLHSSDLDQHVRDRVAMAEELRLAPERGELELHYQPEVEIVSGRVVGLEALIRWNHPRRGLLVPSAFMPTAAQTGSIVPLGRWVFGEACRQFKLWRDEGIAPEVVALNVAAVQFKRPSDLVGDIASSLTRWGVAAKHLELELTESVLMEVVQKHMDVLDGLRQLGVGIAVDDFGLGYSSLDFHTAQPVDRLKVAQELVFRITGHRRNAATVRDAIRLAQRVGVEVMAEGVETEAQANFLASAGCKNAQGHYFGRAMSAESATVLLRKGAVELVRAAPEPAQHVPLMARTLRGATPSP